MNGQNTDNQSAGTRGTGGRYDDIIDLPHHISTRHPRMSMRDRAAQFASFKALSGYEDEIAETGRLTDRRIELEEDEKELLDRQLQQLIAHPDAGVSITWFHPDGHKDGGSYLTARGKIRQIDTLRRRIILTESDISSGEKTEIPLDDILSLSIHPTDPEFS